MTCQISPLFKDCIPWVSNSNLIKKAPTKIYVKLLFFQNPRGMVIDGTIPTESEYQPVKVFSTEDFFKEDDIIKKNKPASWTRCGHFKKKFCHYFTWNPWFDKFKSSKIATLIILVAKKILFEISATKCAKIHQNKKS